MIRFRLHARFLVLIVGSLLILLAVLAVTVIQRETALLKKTHLEQQGIVAQAVATSLRHDMLEGRSRSTIALMKSLQGSHNLARLDVLRTDGSPAFNRSGPPSQSHHFKRALATGQEASFEEHTDRTLHTRIIPLMNESPCITCHAKSGPVLGAILISLSLEDALQEISSGTRQITALMLAFIGIIGASVYFLVRRLVVYPVMQLQSGAGRIGSGEWRHRIPITSRDEFGALASAFNNMARRLEDTYTTLEDTVRERTAQLAGAKADAEAKAHELSEHNQNLAAVSQLSTNFFNSNLTQDELLNKFMTGITQDLGYTHARLCLVNRSRIKLTTLKDVQMQSILGDCDIPLAGNHPIAAIARAGKFILIENSSTQFQVDDIQGSEGDEPLTLAFLPLLSHNYRQCWVTNSCIETKCPAFGKAGEPCWLMPETKCHNDFVASYENKLGYCMTCSVFPVLGILIVGAAPHTMMFRERNISVLHILAAEMGAALENHRLHENKQNMVKSLMELHHVTAAALSGLSLELALDAFTDSALKFSGLDACNFWMLAEQGRELIRKAGGRTNGDEEDHFPRRLPLDRGLLGAVLTNRRVAVEYDVQAKDETALGKSVSVHGMNTVLAIPLQTEERTIGVFSVHKRSTTPFLDTEISVFLLLANQAAMAINACSLNEELKKQNMELAKHINLVNGILASMSSGVVLLDRNGRVMLVNPQAAQILRIKPESINGRELASLFPETGAFLRPEAGPYQEISLAATDGALVPLGFTSSYYEGADGRNEGVIVVFRDLTEVKALEAELLSKERFAAMGRVVSGVAHEIRNPLFGISAIGQIFERDLTNAAHRELARSLVSESRRLNQLVEELLIYGRPLQLNPEPCDMRSLWEEVLFAYRGEMERRGITVHGDYAVKQPIAMLDVNQSKQVFLNLLRNAMDAMPGGGRIEIKLLLDDRYLVFKVIDSGTGISPENAARAFDLFFTTKPKGSGLGLAICKKIVQDHGGEISIDGGARGGAVVTVKLPLKKTSTDDGHEMRADAPYVAAPKNRGRQAADAPARRL